MRNGLLITLFVLSACQDQLLTIDPLARGEEASDQGPHDDYAAAARVSGVPVDLLIAISHVETRMQMVDGHVEFDGKAPSIGLMGLKETQLAEAVRLSGLDEEEVRHTRAGNIQATALLLAAWADDEGIGPNDLDAWAPVVARFSDIQHEEAASEYVHYEVFELLSEGLELEDVVLPPREVAPNYRAPTRLKDGRNDAYALWSPSPNYTSTRYGYTPQYVVIHTCEGSYSGCWGWLSNPAAGASAHYVVNDDGSEVRQLVDEDHRAWHVAANYDCNNNDGHECNYSGITMNTLSVGIEHAGYASQASWSPGLLDRSAELTCGITERHNIPRDSYHIFGHGQIQPWNRTDPGPNWPWAEYLDDVQTACGDHGPTGSTGSTGGTTGGTAAPTTGLPGSFVVDSNNGYNTSARTWIDVGSAWSASANVSGYYNTGYWWARTAASSNLASFHVETDADQCYTVEAWWTSAWDRTNATFIAYDASDRELGRTTVHQGSNGARWNHLGDWTFPAGANRVSLSRWGNGDGVVVADALRFTECD